MVQKQNNMKTLSEKFGKVFTASFRKGNAEISFKFEIAYNDNLFEQKSELLEDTEKCNESVADCIVKEIFDLNMFDIIYQNYECFFCKESGAVRIVNDEEKILIVVNTADFVKVEKISYSDI